MTRPVAHASRPLPPPPVAWGQRSSTVQRAVPALNNRPSHSPPPVIWPSGGKPAQPKLSPGGGKALQPMISMTGGGTSGSGGNQPIKNDPPPNPWSTFKFEAPPKKKAMVARLRSVAGLPVPTKAGSRDIEQVWSWCHTKGTLTIEAVANNEVEILTAAQNLRLILGAGAKVSYQGSSLEIFNDVKIIVSPCENEYNDKKTAMQLKWAAVVAIITNAFTVSKNNNTKILDYLTLKGFGDESPYGTRVLDVGDGYHATFSVFPNNDKNELLSTILRFYKAGNMHITEELYGAAHPNNPHYYHNGKFSWKNKEAACLLEIQSIDQTLAEARSDVLRICKTEIEKYERNLK